MRRPFGKPHARVDDNPLGRDAGVDGAAEAVAQLRRDFGHQIVVHRLGIHRLRAAARVHEHECSAAGRDFARQAGFDAQAADVVDQRGARGDGRPRDLCLVGVNRDRHAEAPLERRHDRQHSRQLLAGGHGLGAGPRRLTADVDEIGAFGLHPEREIGGGCRIAEPLAFGERVGRRVQDAHHQAALSEMEHPVAGKRDSVPAALSWCHAIKNSEFGIWNA